MLLDELADSLLGAGAGGGGAGWAAGETRLWGGREGRVSQAKGKEDGGEDRSEFEALAPIKAAELGDFKRNQPGQSLSEKRQREKERDGAAKGLTVT